MSIRRIGTARYFCVNRVAIVTTQILMRAEIS